MKKNVLILSALLTVVLGAVSLQSCSSDDNYTTEEYGYYTEEEIVKMKMIAEKYNTTISVDENYYGKKASMEEFEETIIQFKNFPGDYQLVKSADNEKYCLIKKSADMTSVNRLKTRAAELAMHGEVSVGTIYPRRPYNTCTIYLSWTLPTGTVEGTASLSASQPFQLGGNYNAINAEITPYYVSIHENVSIIYYGTNCGRYSISGVHRATGNSEFEITEIP